MKIPDGETPAARLTRLKIQKTKMRDWRASRQVTQVGEIDTQLERTERLLSRYAPANIASMPIAMAREGNVWTVDLHIKTQDEEYASSAASRRLQNAIAAARRNLQAAWDRPQGVLSTEGTQS